MSMMFTCAHDEAIASRIEMFGSRLLLCRNCWVVIDPTPRFVPPVSLPTTELVETHVPLETAIPKPLATEPEPTEPAPTPSELDEEFDVPIPRRRLFSTVVLPNKAFLFSLLAIPFSLYATWFYLMYRPTFHEYADPTQQYIAQFPGQPQWTGGSAGGGSDGEVSRKILGLYETYRIKVTHGSDWRFSRIRFLNTEALAEHMTVSGYAIVRPRPDVLIAQASVEYELWINGKDTIVGRIIVVNDLVYELTLRGPHLSLKDSRVQRFFNSFRFAPL
jgi:hypothetical protein